jgi:hypothetical protein
LITHKLVRSTDSEAVYRRVVKSLMRVATVFIARADLQTMLSEMETWLESLAVGTSHVIPGCDGLSERGRLNGEPNIFRTYNASVADVLVTGGGR